MPRPRAGRISCPDAKFHQLNSRYAKFYSFPVRHRTVKLAFHDADTDTDTDTDFLGVRVGVGVVECELYENAVQVDWKMPCAISR